MMLPLRIVGGRNAASGSFRLELDQKSFARGRRLLDHYQGAPLRTRMSKAPLALEIWWAPAECLIGR